MEKSGLKESASSKLKNFFTEYFFDRLFNTNLLISKIAISFTPIFLILCKWRSPIEPHPIIKPLKLL